jgi:fibronectin-binding autotransporter adhesin
MAIRFAVATGNWSNTSTWDGGTLPAADDDVFANARTVTIDQDVNVLSLRNTANTTPAITAGGGFTVSGTRTIELTGSGTGVVCGSANTLTFAGTSAGSLTTTALTASTTTASVSPLVISTSGSVTVNCSTDVIGGAATGRIAIVLSGTGARTLTAPSFRSGSNSSAVGISAGASSGNIQVFGDVIGAAGVGMVTGSGTVTVTGNVSSGGNTGSYGIDAGAVGGTIIVNGNATGQADHAIRISNASVTCTVNGNVVAGTGSSDYGILVSAAATLTVNGNVTGGTGPTTHGILLSSTGGILSIYGIVTGGSSTTAAAGVSCSVGNTTPILVDGAVIGGSSNSPGVFANTVSSRYDLRGEITGGTVATAHGVNITAAAIVSINAICENSSSGAFAANSTSATAILNVDGELRATARGLAISGIAPIRAAPGLIMTTLRSGGGADLTFRDNVTVNASYPVEADVKSGTTYGIDPTYTGTLSGGGGGSTGTVGYPLVMG